MSLPTQANQLTNGYFFHGVPYIELDAKTAVKSLTNGYFYRGTPFLLAASRATTLVAWRLLLVF